MTRLFAICFSVGVVLESVGVCGSSVFWSVGAVGVLEWTSPTVLEAQFQHFTFCRTPFCGSVGVLE